MPKNKFEIKREESFKRIMKAGMEKLCENGYYSTSVQEICEHAGYTKGAFYLHFKNKDDFFLHLLELRSSIRKDYEVPVDQVHQFSSLEEAVSKRVHNFMELMDKTPQWNMVYMEFYIHNHTNPEVKKVYKRFYKVWIDENTSFIDQLIKKKWITPDKNAVILAERWHALFNGVMTHKFLYDVSLDPDELVGMFLRMIRS